MKASLPILALSFAALGFVAFDTTSKPPVVEKVNFDRDVMPIIGQKCFKCHGPDVTKAAAGLRLDSSKEATRDLGGGSAIVPGNPEKSFMIQRITAQSPAMRMPPSNSGVKELSAEQIQTLRTWIAQGAKYEKHWSYIPPEMPSLPVVSNPNWCKNPIDNLVLNKLDQSHLKPEPEADKETLAMRASQTLTGLPPSPELLEAFRKDKLPGAYERFVDRLLASPAYGEHQARYWMDAVRYADTHGLQLDNERGIYPYRDWVVRAYNKDLPFDKFVTYQLAGDLLPHPTTEQLVATGYVRSNLTSNEGGAIEEEFLARNTFDRVDTTSTIFLGLTVQCAKCHDHKYDPISQKDYYGMYAFFDSTKDKALDDNILLPAPVVKAATEEDTARINALKLAQARIRASVNLIEAEQYLTEHRHPVPSSKYWEQSPVYAEKSFDEAYAKVEPAEPGQTSDVAWKPITFEVGKDQANLIGKDNASIYVRGTITFATAQKFTFGVSSDDAVKVWLNGKLIHANKASRGVDQAIDRVTGEFQEGDNQLVVKLINGISTDGLNIRLIDPIDQLIQDTCADYKANPTDPAKIQNLQTVFLEHGPKSVNASHYQEAAKELKQIEDAIPMSLIAQEMDTPRPTYVLKRGQYDQKGDRVERHIPKALGELPKGSHLDRLGLAQWFVSPSNPLVARVFVNRIWQQHFGMGLVKTADDFGSQGEWPLNQPLLDYLAVSFEKNGWSVKKLNRMIVTSATFRQSSRITPEKLTKDPENRLISRGPRFRLDAEVIRDKALMAGGLLVKELGGHGFKPYQPDGLWEGTSDPASSTHFYVRDHDKNIYRRSLYLFWKRTAPPPAMITFDAPLRDTCTVRRSVTNTPLQALTSMNEPSFLEASRTMAQRLLAHPGTDIQRIHLAYDLTLGRKPRPNELPIINRMLASFRKRYQSQPSDAKKLLAVGDAPTAKNISPPEQASWMLICSTLMNTNDFLTLH